MTNTVTDPVCGCRSSPMTRSSARCTTARPIYFCSEHRHQVFLADPHRYGHRE